MNKDIFNQELEICRKLNRSGNDGCAWGKCANCGVIPLLFKLYKGELLETSDEINEVKRSIFTN